MDTPLSKSIQISAPIPHGLADARIYTHITICGGRASNAQVPPRPKRGVIVFLTAASAAGAMGAVPPLGNLVCAFPDLRIQKDREETKLPHSTFLAGSAAGMDFNLSLARALAARLNRPVHLGSSLRLDELVGSGGNVLEQVEAMNLVISMVLRAVSVAEVEPASATSSDPGQDAHIQSEVNDELATEVTGLRV